jgi:hypothetical protein
MPTNAELIPTTDRLEMQKMQQPAHKPIYRSRWRLLPCNRHANAFNNICGLHKVSIIAPEAEKLISHLLCNSISHRLQVCTWNDGEYARVHHSHIFRSIDEQIVINDTA